MKVTQTRVPRSLRVFYMNIIEPIITFDGQVKLIRAGMTENEAHTLRSEMYAGILNLLALAQAEHPKFKDYVNVCRQKENKEES